MPWRLTSIEKAIQESLKYLDHVPSVVEVTIENSVGCVAAEEIRAIMDLPPYHRSAVDGFAVRAEDTIGASPWNPIPLKLKGCIDVGTIPTSSLSSGECMEISTGAPLPEGANAVVMIENSSAKGSIVEVFKGVAVWENVSRKGEDLKADTPIVMRGMRIRPWHVASLAAQGIGRVKVYEPRVAVMSTGDELIEINRPLQPGKIYCYTKYLIKAWLKERKCKPVDYGILPDEENAIRKALKEAIEANDVTIITGGTSVGKKDYTVKAIRRLEKLEYIVHGLAVKPGKPTALAIVEGKPILATSGLPVAALVALEMVLQRLLSKMLGCKEALQTVVRGKLIRRVTVEPGMLGFVRVRVYKRGKELLVEPLRVTGSGVLRSLLDSNGLLIVPEDLEGFEEGETVEVILHEPPEDLP